MEPEVPKGTKLALRSSAAPSPWTRVMLHLRLPSSHQQLAPVPWQPRLYHVFSIYAGFPESSWKMLAISEPKRGFQTFLTPSKCCSETCFSANFWMRIHEVYKKHFCTSATKIWSKEACIHTYLNSSKNCLASVTLVLPPLLSLPSSPEIFAYYNTEKFLFLLFFFFLKQLCGL